MKTLVTTSMAIAAFLFLNAANAQTTTGSSVKGTTHATVNATKAATAATNAVNKTTNATTNAVNKTTNAASNAVKASTNVAIKASKATVNSAQSVQTSAYTSNATETKIDAKGKGLKTENSAKGDANVDVSGSAKQMETVGPNKPAEEAKSTKGMIEASSNASEQAHVNSNEHSAVQKGDALLQSNTSTSMDGSATVSAKPATKEVKETTTETKTNAANKVADVKEKSSSARPSLKADASTSVQADSKIKVGNK